MWHHERSEKCAKNICPPIVTRICRVGLRMLTKEHIFFCLLFANAPKMGKQTVA